jgi:hypothetical protein
MLNTILEGVSLIDTAGLVILGTTLTTLLLAVVMNLRLRGRYKAMHHELATAEDASGLSFPVLRNIFTEAQAAAQQSSDPNLQAIVEDRFQADLKGLLLGERFVRAATGLVIILGLLGTFYGLTLSIGRIVHLVSGATGAATDIAMGVSTGLTHALSGMAVAFSNSLVGVLSAVLLTVLGILSNISDQRTSVMLQVETALCRAFPKPAPQAGPAPGSPEALAKLDQAVGRFEQALTAFATSTRDFREFNSHLKDNIQRLSLTFAELSDTVQLQVNKLKPPFPPRG